MSTKKETKLSKYVKVPIKMLVKARDLYIRNMNKLSFHDLLGGSSGMAFGIPTVCHVGALQGSFSASHAQNSARAKEDRVAALVRAASARNMTVDTQHGPSKFRQAKSLRSCGDGHEFERIDETSPLINLGIKDKKFQRSKSYGAVKFS